MRAHPGSFTPSRDYPEALARAAQTWGIELEYWDIFGNRHAASEQAQKSILASLGLDESSVETIDRALEEHLWNSWSRPLPPTVVLGSEELEHLTISLPNAMADAVARLCYRLEDGTALSQEIALSGWASMESVQLRGQHFVRKHIPVLRELPLGYHRVALNLHGQETETFLIVAPDRAYYPPELEGKHAAGIAVSLYGLRSERNWGCGDFTDLLKFIGWAVDELGVGFVALNPLHAIANRQPYNTSPYLPNCAFYRNFIYLDLETVEDFQNCPAALKILSGQRVQREIAALRAAPYVEYERISRLKHRLSKLAFRQFLREHRTDTPRAQRFRAYQLQQGRLLKSFAIHSALDEAIHKHDPDVWNWVGWPEGYKSPNSAATNAFAKSHWRSILFYEYIQWLIDEQLEAAQRHARNRGMAIGLYHDLALATDRFGSDLWAHRAFYVNGCRVGAPPDNFSPKGQDWAFPPPSARAHFENGYQLFADSIRNNCRHGGVLRIDHVMRFFHLFWIPDGMEASQGVYVQDRYQDLIRILALESVRNRVIVVGEDLGTVPDFVRETLSRYRILSYRLLYFEQDRQGKFRAPSEYPVEALVSASTHDLPTLAGFWEDADIHARRQAGILGSDEDLAKQLAERTAEKQKLLDFLHQLQLLPANAPRDAAAIPRLNGDLHNAVVGCLATTQSCLLVLNQEDLFKETAQQNLPGSTAEYPNWRHKMSVSVEALRSQPARDYARMFRAWLERTGRVNAT